MSTAAASQQQIAREIQEYMRQRGGTSRTWYVGIARDARARLFSDHGVREHSDAWIFRRAASSADARSVEKYFIDQCGTDGGPGGGDAYTVFVYAYKKASHTRE